MANDPGQVYGEPKYPVRMNYVTSEEQRKAIGAVAAGDGVTLGEAQRRLIEEALDMRKHVEQAEREFARADEGREVCEVVETPAGTALVRGPRSLKVPDEDGSTRRGVPVGLARVGNQLAKPRPAAAGEVVMSRAQLIAQERGEAEGR
jgi:hypothetical protein